MNFSDKSKRSPTYIAKIKQYPGARGLEVIVMEPHINVAMSLRIDLGVIL